MRDFARTAPDSPKRSGRSMAERRSGTASEHSCHPPPLPRNDLVPNGVDPVVNSMKPSEPQAPIDRILAQPTPTELSAAHYPMLPLCQLSNPRISEASLR